MVRGAQPVGRKLQAIRLSNDVVQIGSVGSQISLKFLAQSSAISLQPLDQLDNGGAILVDIGKQVPGMFSARRQVKRSVHKISAALAAYFCFGSPRPHLSRNVPSCAEDSK